MQERISVHPPSRVKQVLETLKLREVEPSDLCLTSTQRDLLYQKYPQLAGDQSAIGVGDDGSCQAWRNNSGWWKEFIQIER